MTAMNLLPADTREMVSRRTPGLRDDLLAIPGAEADGWNVSFRNNAWGNPASFEKAGVHVWRASDGWRRASVIGGRFQAALTFPTLDDALRNNTPVLLGTPLT